MNLQDSSLKSWVDIPDGSDFPIQNLPLGIFRTWNLLPRPGIAIGEHVVDLGALEKFGYFKKLNFRKDVFKSQVLNEFIGQGKEVINMVRERVAEILLEGNTELQKNPKALKKCLYHMSEVVMEMPVRVGDYTDFYSSYQHAYNVGVMFRGKDNAIMPNWHHMPIGYHGRSSSIVSTGASIHRPKGQTLPAGKDKPTFGPSKALDFELEMAFVTCTDSEMGESISVADAEEHILGVLLFNDLSARDIQKWEYQPLGPFLGKNFGSVVSPWIVLLDSLEPFRTKGPKQDPAPMSYLKSTGNKHFDINLEVAIRPEDEEETVVCQSNFKNLYWNMSQQLAHQTVNGCNIKIGDMYASGTISGDDASSYGSMLELSWKGEKPIKLNDGTTRTYLEDWDTVIMRAHCQKRGYPRIGFGESRVEILPAMD